MSESPHGKSTLTLLVITLTVLLLLLVGLFVVRTRLNAQLQSNATAQDAALEKLATRITGIETRVEELSRNASPDAAATNETLVDAQKSLEAVTARLDALEKTIGDTRPALTVAVAPPAAPAQAAPIPTATASTSPAVLTPWNALKLAALGGQPYASALDAWASTRKPTQETDVLRSFAQSGIPTEGALLQQLDTALDHASKRSPTVDDVSLVGKINTHLAGLVSIKKSDTADVYAALRRARTRGDIGMVMREVDQLDASARAPLADWFAAAQSRQQLLALLNAPEPESAP